MAFSSGQQAYYRPLVKRAFLIDCMSGGVSPNTKGLYKAWYEEQLLECLGMSSTSKCNRTTDFETVMLHFAIIAEDQYWIDRATCGDERRLKNRLQLFLLDIEELTGTKTPWNYVLSIYGHTGAPRDFKDATTKQLRSVIGFMDKHIRRLCAQAGIRPRDLQTRQRTRKNKARQPKQAALPF